MAHIGKKEMNGDDASLLQKHSLLNRKKGIYKFKDIQSQSLTLIFIIYMKV